MNPFQNIRAEPWVACNLLIIPGFFLYYLLHVATGKTKIAIIYKYVYRMIFIGIALAGMLAYNPASVRSRHRWVNLLDPGHQPLPIQHQLDILD